MKRTELIPLILSFVIGSQTLIFNGLIGALNNEMNKTFSPTMYNLSLVIMQLPSALFFLFVPTWSINMGNKKSNVYNLVVNSLALMLYGCSFITGRFTPLKSYMLLCTSIVLARSANMISENNLMTMSSTMDAMSNMVFIAGGSFSNFIVIIMLTVIRSLPLGENAYMIMLVGLPILFNALTGFCYYNFDKYFVLYKDAAKNENKKTCESGKDAKLKKDERPSENVIIFVLKRKFKFYGLLFTLFLFLNSVYPNYMYKMFGSNYILYAYSVSEFLARIVVCFPKVTKFLTEKKVVCFCVIFYFLCGSAMFLYFIHIKVIVAHINPTALKVILVILYFIIAVGHGMLGSSLCRLINENLDHREYRSAANTLYIGFIMISILLGNFINYIIDKRFVKK